VEEKVAEFRLYGKTLVSYWRTESYSTTLPENDWKIITV